MDGDYFSMQKSNLHRRLRDRLGPAADPYLIDDGGSRPRRYRLRLPATAIRFADGRLATGDTVHNTGHTFAQEPPSTGKTQP